MANRQTDRQDKKYEFILDHVNENVGPGQEAQVDEKFLFSDFESNERRHKKLAKKSSKF